MIAPTRIIAKVAIRLAGSMQVVQAPTIAGNSYMLIPFLFLAWRKLIDDALAKVNTSHCQLGYALTS